MVERDHKSLSLADQVFEKLEQDILSGKHERGEILTELGLCGELGVSRTPVREALTRLAQEHLVRESGRGIEVLGITRADLIDIMEIRLRLEGIVTYQCAERITKEELEKLKEALELQEFYLSKGNSDKIKTLDSHFHAMIYRFSGSNIFYDVLEPLHNKVQRYRKASLEAIGRAEKSFAEHVKIYEALAAHDPRAAEARMNEHVKNIMENIREGN